MVKDLETKFKYPICGSLRIGEKNEKNIPQKLDYFTVHEDSHTEADVVKQFHLQFNKPKELIIRFINQDPFEASYVRYGKSGLLCKGDGETADCKGEKEWSKCECSKECEHRGTDCKLTGRLLFMIKGLNIGGLWRLQTQSYNTIQNIFTTLNFLKSMGINIAEREFKLATEENKSIVDGKVKKYTTVTLKMIVNSSEKILNDVKTNILPDENITEGNNNVAKTKKVKSKSEEIKDVKSEEQEKINCEENPKEQEVNEDDFEKYLTLVEINDSEESGTKVKKATFCTMHDEIVELLLHPEVVNKVCEWEIGSTILPTNIYEKNNNKILKEFIEKDIIKKAV